MPYIGPKGIPSLPKISNILLSRTQRKGLLIMVFSLPSLCSYIPLTSIIPHLQTKFGCIDITNPYSFERFASSSNRSSACSILCKEFLHSIASKFRSIAEISLEIALSPIA